MAPHVRNSKVLGQSGFTLIELILVVVIIGLVAAFSMPRIDYNKYRINSAMRGVGSALMGAQRRAVSKQHDLIITFNPTTNAIRLHEDANNNGSVDAGERTTGIPMGEHVVFGRNGATAHALGGGPIILTKQVGGIPALTFHRNGAASEHGGIYLCSRRQMAAGGHLTDNRFLEIERATGRVSWYTYLGGTWERGF